MEDRCSERELHAGGGSSAAVESDPDVFRVGLSALVHPRPTPITQVTRPSEPWEFSDGAVYLVRELCFANPDMGVVFFEEIADIARLTHFVQADSLRETIWKQVGLD